MQGHGGTEAGTGAATSVADPPIHTVRVALLGSAVPSVPSLQAALAALRVPHPADWELFRPDAAASGATVDIALADTAPAVAVALDRWPDAAAVALVPAGDEGTAAIAALDAGATVCVRGADVGLIAAYLHAVARRRGLLDPRDLP